MTRTGRRQTIICPVNASETIVPISHDARNHTKLISRAPLPSFPPSPPPSSHLPCLSFPPASGLCSLRAKISVRTCHQGVYICVRVSVKGGWGSRQGFAPSLSLPLSLSLSYCGLADNWAAFVVCKSRHTHAATILRSGC